MHGNKKNSLFIYVKQSRHYGLSQCTVQMENYRLECIERG